MLGLLLPFRLVAAEPQRVLSLDFCADQYVLQFVPAERIIGLSPNARKDFSFLRAKAATVPLVRPQAEDVLLRRPDLVVRSYGGGPKISDFLQRAGIPLLQLPWVNSLDQLMLAIASTATALGASHQGETMLTDLRQRLGAIDPPEQDRLTALYMTPGGVSTGPGSLIHELILAAGLSNFIEKPGWHALPLEQLIYQQPDLIIAAFFSGEIQHLHHWSAMSHPVAQRHLRQQPLIELSKASLACTAWPSVDAVEAMAKASRKLRPRPADS